MRVEIPILLCSIEAMKRFFAFVMVALAVAGAAMAARAQTNPVAPNPAPEVKWFKKENFFSTLVGGAVAIAGGLAATWWSHKLQARHQRLEDSEFSENVLRAIRRELEALGEIYAKGIGKALHEVPEGKPLSQSLALTQEWFTVFNSNAVHLGKIEGELSERIIIVYARTKHVIEEFRINNNFIEHLNEATAELRVRPRDEFISGKLQMLQEMMLLQVKRIRQSDQALKTASEELFALFDRRGIK
jgi:hypothetical protein